LKKNVPHDGFNIDYVDIENYKERENNFEYEPLEDNNQGLGGDF
jgi:hypothetical protein